MGDEVEELVKRLREIALNSAKTSDYDGETVTMLSGNHSEIICALEEAAADLESLRSSLTRVEEERDAAYMRAADLAETFQRDGSFDDSMVGAVEHNSNQANIAAAIRGLSRADGQKDKAP